jgi:hypothetical protein
VQKFGRWCAAAAKSLYYDAQMSFFPPVTSSGSRVPEKRPRVVPKHVRHMIELMVRGRPDDEDCAPLNFIEAGRIAGIAPDRARRWLDRPEVRSFLRAERRAFRDAICAGNEGHLARIRGGPNANAAVRAIAVLEELDDAEMHPRRGQVQQAGLAIVLIDDRGATLRPAKPVTTIEHEPSREPHREPDDAV